MESSRPTIGIVIIIKKKKTILIFGGKGFIGKNLLNDLRGKYRCWCATKKNKNIYKSRNFDFLINANGNSNKRLAQSDPILDFNKSVLSTLESVASFKYKHYIFISSCEVYPNLSQKKDTKENVKADSILSKYGFHKFLSEQIVRQYCPEYTILRLSTPIGPGLKKGPIFDLISGGKVWVSLKSRFHVLHTRYISDFIHSLIKTSISCQTFNLVSRNSISIERIIQMLNLSKPDEKENKIISHSINSSKANKIMILPSSETCILDFQKKKKNK